MPAKGQHRKPRTNRLTRICLAAGTGSAALVLPLATAGHAAAAQPARTAPATVPQNAAGNAAPAAAEVAASVPAAAPTSSKAARGTLAGKAERYEVVSGDSLSKIARVHHTAGGWHRIYADNRQVIGSDPDLIFPGQRFTLNGSAAATPAPATPAPAPAKPKPEPAAPAGSPASAKKPAESSASGYTKPVGNAPIGTPYHAAGPNWASGFHTGVDFLVGTGTPVHSVAAGTVVSAGPDGSYGNDVIVRHADGRYTLYGHLSQVLVSAGQSVAAGRQIGISGATGNVTGPHLHFEARTTPDYGSDIDPVAYLRSHGVSL